MEDGAGLDPVAVAFRVEGLRAEGVSDARSTLRFLFAGAAAAPVVFFFLDTVAVPFLVGAGRFLLGAAAGFSSVAGSVEGTGTEDSRSGDCILGNECSDLREATGFRVWPSPSGCAERRASMEMEVVGVGSGSRLADAEEAGSAEG